MISGFSGSGKSTSIKYLDPKTTFLISCTNKQPQIPGYKTKYIKINKDNMDTGNWLVSNNYSTISKMLLFIANKRPDITEIVVDDLNYLLSNHVMSTALEKGFDKFNMHAKNYYDLITLAQNLPDHLTIAFTSHIENVGTEIDPILKLYTTGN